MGTNSLNTDQTDLTGHAFFSLMRGGRIHIPLSAGYYRPAGKTSFKWRLAGVPMMAQR